MQFVDLRFDCVFTAPAAASVGLERRANQRSDRRRSDATAPRNIARGPAAILLDCCVVVRRPRKPARFLGTARLGTWPTDPTLPRCYLKARGVCLGNPNGAAALRRAGKGGAPLRKTIAVNAERHARDLAPVVADIRGTAGRGVSSLRAIAAELNGRGMLTRRGGCQKRVVAACGGAPSKQSIAGFRGGDTPPASVVRITGREAGTLCRLGNLVHHADMNQCAYTDLGERRTRN